MNMQGARAERSSSANKKSQQNSGAASKCAGSGMRAMQTLTSRRPA
jgi:hypothetical protein